MDFWNWKLIFLMSVTINGWILIWFHVEPQSLLGYLVLILKCDNESKIERFWFKFNELSKPMDFCLMKKPIYFFQKLVSSWKNMNWIMTLHVLINELYKGNHFDGNFFLKIDALLLFNYNFLLKVQNIYKINELSN
jgi:hypothetical protein